MASLSLRDPDLLRRQAYIGGRWCDAESGGRWRFTTPRQARSWLRFP